MADSAPPVLRVHALWKRFGHLEVLRGVSFTAAEGAVISIIGASGSGKSTLLRCVNLLEVPEQGEIALDGETIRLRTRRDGTREPEDRAQVDRVRARIGMVFQSFNLFPHMSVSDNITLAPTKVLGVSKRDARARAEALLERIGLIEKIDEYPDRLSGGQQQRVAIVRALAMRPRVLLLDEVTSALDPELVTEVLALIRELANEGMTMLLATHEMGFARDVATKIAFLYQGQIEEEGPPAQVFGDPRSERTRTFLRSIIEAKRM